MASVRGALRNWKTTLAGIIAFIAAAGPQFNTLLDSDPLTNPDWSLIAAAAGILIGLLTARDSDVTSETSGAK